MAKITITNPPPFKRYFHNCASGKTERVCRRCGSHIYGRNAGICLECLAKMRKGANNDKR